MTVQIATWGSHLSGRGLGAMVRGELAREIEGARTVTFDFSGVTNMSPSFADECFGALIESLAHSADPPQVSFVGLEDDLLAILRFVVGRRTEESRLSA